jgi:methyl-accepting chemotaxis protein
MEMIQRLQSGASETVSTMEAGQTATQETVIQATTTKEVLDAIQIAVSSISDMNAQIAAAAEEQSSVAEELNRNITVISDIGNENANSSEETDKAGNELFNLAEQLQRQVGAFKI